MNVFLFQAEGRPKLFHGAHIPHALLQRGPHCGQRRLRERSSAALEDHCACRAARRGDPMRGDLGLERKGRLRCCC